MPKQKQKQPTIIVDEVDAKTWAVDDLLRGNPGAAERYAAATEKIRQAIEAGFSIPPDLMERLGRNATREAERHKNLVGQLETKVLNQARRIADVEAENARLTRERNHFADVMCKRALQLGAEPPGDANLIPEPTTYLTRAVDGALATIEQLKSAITRSDEDEFAARLRMKVREKFPDLRGELIEFGRWLLTEGAVRRENIREEIEATVDRYFGGKGAS